MKIMTLNCGSSSVKYGLWDTPTLNMVCSGIIERIGIGEAISRHKIPGKKEIYQKIECPSHESAIKHIMLLLTNPEYKIMKDISEIKAVGHRVVHGGENFNNSVIIDEDVIKTIIEHIPLAPLHNPANLIAIRSAMTLLKNIPHIACWDTAFSAPFMPQYAYIYAIPYEFYEKYRIRRYGYHGLSHLYVAKRATVLMHKKASEVNIITLHIGNGTSITAVKKGIAYDQSLGFSTCGEGPIMGTRCGDLDPTIPLFLMQKEHLTYEQVEDLLYNKSGVLGLTGNIIDRRDVIKAASEGDSRSKLALEIECYKLKKYIGAYAAVMGGVDALIFTAGVGENSPFHREKACENLEFLGIKIDSDKNKSSLARNGEIEISTSDSLVKVFVIPTDEELVIAEDTLSILEHRYNVHTNFTYSFEKSDFIPTYMRK